MRGSRGTATALVGILLFLVSSCTASLDTGARPGQVAGSSAYVTLDVDAQPIGLQEGLRDPAGFTSRVLPEYPREAIEGGIGGFVQVHVFVDANGWPRDVQVVRSNPMFDTAVVAAVQHSTYRPARDLNGDPVESWLAVIARFEPR